MTWHLVDKTTMSQAVLRHHVPMFVAVLGLPELLAELAVGARLLPFENPKLAALVTPRLTVASVKEVLGAGAVEVAFRAWPNPPNAHPTSIPFLMLQSQARINTGVLMSTLRTGKMSGYREGAGRMNSAR